MVHNGLDVFLYSYEKYRGRSIALIANYTSVTSRLAYGWEILSAKGLTLKKIFSPEHGLFGTEQDQAAVLKEPGIDFEVVSLYGDSATSLRPSREDLAGIDLVLFDMQDVGARYYTFVNTMCMFMREISGMGIECIVLDRPNPIGGEAIEGPMLRDAYHSFVGFLPVSVRHGMTAGELALFARDYYAIDVQLAVVPMKGWERGMYFCNTGLPWVPPSPNMPTPGTALVYPGMCLLEGTAISEGRGTTTPFEVFGAPGIDPFLLAMRLNELGLDGVFFRPHYFKPTFNKHAGKNSGGVFIHVTDEKRYNSFAVGVACVKVLHDICPDMEFLHGVYEFNSEHPAFDLLAGSVRIREMIVKGDPLNDICDSWKDEEREFARARKEYLLY